MQWLKMSSTILDDSKIKLIRKHPDGDALFVLWVGLLCLAMQQETDCIYIAAGVPFEVDDMATLFGLEPKTVQLGIAIFKRYEMVDIDGGGGLRIINFGKHQTIEKLQGRREQWRLCQQKKRETAQNEAESTQCQQDVNTLSTQCQHKEIEIEIEIEKETTIPDADASLSANDFYKQIEKSFADAYEEKTGKKFTWSSVGAGRKALRNIKARDSTEIADLARRYILELADGVYRRYTLMAFVAALPDLEAGADKNCKEAKKNAAAFDMGWRG